MEMPHSSTVSPQRLHFRGPMHHKYDPISKSSLSTNYKLLKHVFLRGETQPKPIASEGRNFALCVLEKLSENFTQFKVDFHALANPWTMEATGAAFVDLVRHYVRRHAKHGAVSPFIDEKIIQRKFTVRELAKLRQVSTKESAMQKGNQGKETRRSSTQSMEDEEFDAIVEDDEAFTDCCWRLFRALDVDDSDAVTWNEFSDFMCDCAVRGPAQQPLERINLYCQNEALPRGTRQVFTVKRFLNWNKCNAVAVLSNDSWVPHGPLESVIEAYNPQNLEVCEMKYWFSASLVIGFEFLSKLKAIVVSCADLQLRMYDMRYEKSEPLVEHSAEDTYTNLTWCERWKKLYATSTTGTIATWTIPVGLHSGKFKIIASQRVHQSNITRLIFLPIDGSVVSCSMDPKLVIQEPSRGEVIANLVGHKSAIRDLTYNPDYHCIISVGFDSELLLWNLSSFASSGCVETKPIPLKDIEEPHRPAIVSVICIPNSPQVVSLDQFGLFKVWDIRLFQCTQNITVNVKNASSIRDKEFFGMEYLPESKQLLCYTHKFIKTLSYTSLQKDVKKESADDAIIGLGFSTSSATVISATQSSILCWEGQSGVLSGDYIVKDEQEVTAMALDYAGRRVLVGYRGGEVAYFSSVNGAKFLSLQASEFDIVDVACHAFQGVSFAVDSEGVVFGFSDRPESLEHRVVEYDEDAKFLRVCDPQKLLFIFHSEYKITTFKLRASKGAPPVPHRSFVIQNPKQKEIGNKKNELTMSNVNDMPSELAEELGTEGDDAVDERGEISCACIIGNFPLLCCGDDTKCVSLWTIPSHPDPYQCVGRWTNTSHWEISTMSFANLHYLLYVGRADGTILCFSMRRILEELNLIATTSQAKRLRRTSFVSMPTENSSFTANLQASYLLNANLDLVRQVSCPAAIRICQVLQVETLNVIFVSTMERSLYAYSADLSSSLGYLSIDCSKYRSDPESCQSSIESAIAEKKECPLHLEPDTGLSNSSVSIFEQTELSAAQIMRRMQSSKMMRSNSMKRQMSLANVKSKTAPSFLCDEAEQGVGRLESSVASPMFDLVEFRFGPRCKTPMNDMHFVNSHQPIMSLTTPPPLGRPPAVSKSAEVDNFASDIRNRCYEMKTKRKTLNQRERREQRRLFVEEMWASIRRKTKKAEIPRGAMPIEKPTVTIEMINQLEELDEQRAKTQQAQLELRAKVQAGSQRLKQLEPLLEMDKTLESEEALVRHTPYEGCLARLAKQRAKLQSQANKRSGMSQLEGSGMMDEADGFIRSHVATPGLSQHRTSTQRGVATVNASLCPGTLPQLQSVIKPKKKVEATNCTEKKWKAPAPGIYWKNE